MNYKKVILTNFLIFLFLIFVLEIIFGYWFKKESFGIYMQKHRNMNEYYEVFNKNQIQLINYKRNFFGFRGDKVDDLSKIKIVFIGGSTGNERFLNEEYTIVGKLNSLLLNNNYKSKIYNASIDGKTVQGYINDFKFWFSKLNDFNPEVFIFYTGINDSLLNQPLKHDELYSNKKILRIRDYIGNNSITIELLKKVEDKYFIKKKLEYDLNKNLSQLYDKNYLYFNYSQAEKFYSFENLKNKHSDLKLRFETRLNNLLPYLNNYNSTPIFITQVYYNGLLNEQLFLINELLKEFCKKNNIYIIKLDEIYNPQREDFYDPVHTTAQGSDNMSKIIYSELLKINKNKKILY
jgi:lysophospholipase L1-like esterase